MTQTMKVNRDFKGIWIPRQIYLHKELSWTEKILLVEIDSLDCGEGCFASNEYFAKFLGKSIGQISAAISHLRSLNLIFDRRFDGRKRYISVKADYREPSRQTTGKPVGRLQENHTQNNTSINIPPLPVIEEISKNIDIDKIVEVWKKETGKTVGGSELVAAELEYTIFLTDEVTTGFGAAHFVEAIKNYGDALRIPNTKVWKNRTLVDFIRKCKNFLPGYYNAARYRDEYSKSETVEKERAKPIFAEGQSPKEIAKRQLLKEKLKEQKEPPHGSDADRCD